MKDEKLSEKDKKLTDLTVGDVNHLLNQILGGGLIVSLLLLGGLVLLVTQC